jgi:hypothetical protein
MAHEENATAMLLCQTGEVAECAPGFVGTVAINGPKVAVQWVDDKEAGLGSLQGVFEHGRVS